MAKKAKGIRNIRRIETGNTKGWQFHCHVRGFQQTKLFSDKLYGGKNKAKKAAIEYRDDYMAKVPDPRLRIEMKSNANNSSGVIGVSLVYRGETPYMQASCKDNEGRRLTKNFNAAVLGKKEAMRKAKNWRRTQLRKRKKELEAILSSEK